jgi:hypothetical protein
VYAAAEANNIKAERIVSVFGLENGADETDWAGHRQTESDSPAKDSKKRRVAVGPDAEAGFAAYTHLLIGKL